MADNPTIRIIRIQFKQHIKEKYNKAHTHLNNYFSHSLPKIEALYTGDSQTTYNANFIDNIRNQSIDVITDDICMHHNE